MEQSCMPLIGNVILTKKPVRELLVKQCNNYRDAVRLCITKSPKTTEQVANHLRMSLSSLYTIINRGGSEKRKRYLDPDLFGKLESFCGNTAVSQYFALEAKGELNRQQDSDAVDITQEIIQQRRLLEQMLLTLNKHSA